MSISNVGNWESVTGLFKTDDETCTPPLRLQPSASVVSKFFSTVHNHLTSFPRSPQPTYTIISLFENLDKACEMTVFPQPNAPGIAVVPPCTQLHGFYITDVR